MYVLPTVAMVTAPPCGNRPEIKLATSSARDYGGVTTKRELAELTARVRAVALMPGISAEEARPRLAVIFRLGGYIPDDESADLFTEMCQSAGISEGVGREIRDRTEGLADAENWPDLVDTDGRGEIDRAFTFEFASDGVIHLEGDAPMEAHHAQNIIDILRDRFGPALPDVAGPERPVPPGGKPKLRVVSSLPEPGENPPSRRA